MRYMVQRKKAGKKGMISQAFEIGTKYGMSNLFQAEATAESPRGPGDAVKEIRLRQKQGLKEVRMGKVIHGIFATEVNKKGCDRVAKSAWLSSGNFQAATEGLIVAAQDGVIHTAVYRHSVLRDGSNPTCRE